jgi:hypothetical protein
VRENVWAGFHPLTSGGFSKAWKSRVEIFQGLEKHGINFPSFGKREE